MSENFNWTPALVKRLFKLRFENEALFRRKRQPWQAFYQILIEDGFPEEMTLDHVRKKWSYTYDCYRIAKKTKNKNWKYYKLFDKHFGHANVLDKYDSWTDEWRTKLIESIMEAKEIKLNGQNMWKMVEKSLRSQNLPSDCCIQDIKSLWAHLNTTFNRKHRAKTKVADYRKKKRKRPESPEWSLYDVMLKYYSTYDKEALDWADSEGAPKKSPALLMMQKRNANVDGVSQRRGGEFQWTRDITETFIQIRLQHDWLFKESKWSWMLLLSIMIEQYGFPPTLTTKDLCRKWTATFSEYQKAKATKNTSWVYFNLFECYIGDGSFSLNPLIDWQDVWVVRLINTRTELEHLFFNFREQLRFGWREVEKKLRRAGLPDDHSLLDLQDIWTYLLKTYKWKRKFADKGVLNEQWPFFEAMSQYKVIEKRANKRAINPPADCDTDEHHDNGPPLFDDDDDIKLFDLKQRMRLKQEASVCRACGDEEGSYNIHEACDDHGLTLADKLNTVVGLQICKTDNLPSQICFTCLRDLETAFAFKQKCLDADKKHRSSDVKLEIKTDNSEPNNTTKPTDYPQDFYDDDTCDNNDSSLFIDSEPPKDEKPLDKKAKKKYTKPRKNYVYTKVCEICGKYTQNLVAHLDAHAEDKMYGCDLCDKRFKFKTGLMIHKAIHDPVPKKTCEVCGKTFHILAQYRRHFVYHANERKHACETCGKRFNTIDILKVHQRMHTDERPFACPDCGKTFRTAGCVSRHRRIVHKKSSKPDQNIIPQINDSYLSTLRGGGGDGGAETS